MQPMQRPIPCPVMPILITTFVALSLLGSAAYAIPAFPGAEGFGAPSIGGRNGDVYHVTSLADTNTIGTLRYGINNAPSSGRTIVFDISGTIALTSQLSISHPNITIAGQTAPGDGICLKNEDLKTYADNLIIRHIRSRVGDQGTSDCDAIWGRYHNNIIIDHCDASWSIDECLSLYANNNVTVQYCMATESLYHSHHEKGNHGYGGIWGGNNASWHHNLLAHNSSRNPRFAGAGEINIDFRNNVIYNWGFNSAYGGEQGTINMVNNYYKYGPATDSDVRNRIVEPSLDPNYGWTSKWYIEGNYVYGYPAITADNWAGGVQGSAPLGTIRAYTPAPYAPVYTQSAEEAFTWVLANVGDNLHRDSIDTRIVNEVLTGTATYGGTWGAGKGIIDSQTQVGGYPTYPQLTRDANFDTDGDGMLNSWETSHGLDPNVADNNGDIDNDGYTNLEEYLHWLAPIPPPKPIIWLGGSSGTAGRYELITNWDIPWQPTLADRAEINSGKATVAYPNQEAGTLYVANTAAGSAELAVTAGKLTIGNALHLGSASGARGTASISGGLMAISGSLALGGGGGGAVGLLTLTGGSLTATGPIVLASAASSTGELKVARAAYVEVGGLTINSGGGRSTKVSMELDANGPSLIRTTGAATLAGTLAVDRTTTSYRPSQGNQFALILATSGAGNFSTITSNIPGLLLKDPNTPALGYWPIFRGTFDANADYVVTFQGAMPGDAGGDNKVNAADLGDLAANWGQSGRSWTQADFGGDGQVNAADLGDLAANWGQTGLAPSAAPPEAPIPEPATLTLLSLVSLAALRRRR